MHRDSLGSVQLIEPGAVNWMTAGAGIVHSERMPAEVREHNRAVEGIQMWVALPREQEEGAAGFWHYPAEVLPLVSGPGAQVRVLCGEFGGARSPVATTSPTLYLAVELRAQGSITLPADYTERGLYIVCGDVLIAGEPVDEYELVVLAEGATVTISALDESRIMILGGDALDGPRQMWWNFVVSDRERIEAAKARWRDGAFGSVPGETEFIPLPDR